MKRKSFQLIAVLGTVLALGTGCQKGDLLSNPNAASENSSIPVSLILNHITYSMYAGGGTVDSRPGYVNEIPWDLPGIWSQYHLSNYQYYRGNNFYNWSVSATFYDMLKYAVKMEEQTARQYGATTPSKYFALAKFFRAYSAVWLTQRVGDIPMTEAGDPGNLTPSYDTQHDVYKNSLALLDTANTQLAALITPANANTVLDAQGDIYGLTYLQWQKLINTYKLRVLISLSKRADDNADLNIKGQFSDIISNPSKYPIMTANSDNLSFKYNTAYNPYAIWARGNGPYNGYANMSKTLLDITTANHDPRVFIEATPAPAQIASGKTASDFTAYVGADINLSLADLNTNSRAGMYSFANYNRYYNGSPAGASASAEPYIIIGYPEMCFNVAEGINRGWASGSAATWYMNGINASIGIYGLTQGQSYTVGDASGSAVGTVTIDIAGFLSNSNVAYAGDDATGLNQILEQKYVALFENSGWEAFYNWRRTGVPAFSQGGVGIGTPSNQIPRRWQYPQDEVLYNGENNSKAVSSQFGGTDDLTKDTWLTK